MIDADEILHSARLQLAGSQRGAAAAEDAVVGGQPISKRFESNIDYRRDEYHLAEFVLFQDQELIEILYRCLLKREPDRSGTASTLEDLRSGQCDHVDIVCRLLDSAEGRLRGVSVQGLDRARRRRRLYRLPVIGPGLKRLAVLLSVRSMRLQLDRLARHTIEQRAALRDTQLRLAETQSELHRCRADIERLQLQSGPARRAAGSLQGLPGQ